jgi:hypothetical protein
MSTKHSPAQVFPSKILLMIGTYLEAQNQRESLALLARTSRTAWKTITPLLYKSVIVPYRNSMTGLSSNFGYRQPKNASQPSEFQIGKKRGLHILRMIHDLTLESIPRVIKINNMLPETSDWHELMIFTSHHHFLNTQKRLKRMTITGSAVRELQMADPVAATTSQGFDQVTMPSDGLPPSLGTAEFTFFPQSGFSLASLIAFFQPLQLFLQYPLTWYQEPRLELEPPHRPLSLETRRPQEVILADALQSLDGEGATVCAHDLHDQLPPVGYIGSRHHLSFVAFPSVPILWEPPKSLLPYVSLHYRLLQIKRVIVFSNPGLPNATSCHGEARRPTNLHQWKASREGTWTFYRVGAMATDIVARDEWFHGAGIERRIRAWVKKTYTEENGHPKRFADDINSRIRRRVRIGSARGADVCNSPYICT